jgi:hypothetical protein
MYAVFETRCATAFALSAPPGRVQQGRTSAVLLRALVQLPALCRAFNVQCVVVLCVSMENASVCLRQTAICVSFALRLQLYVLLSLCATDCTRSLT